MALEFAFVPWVYTALVGITLASAFALCGGKKKQDRGTSEPASKDKTGSKDKDCKRKGSKDKFRAPEKKYEMAGTYDPNYQTLANCSPDVFGPNPQAQGPKPPPTKPTGYAGTYDANYQTLNAVDNNVFGNDKAAGHPPAAPRPPAQPGAMAGTYDPNYQTLAGIDNNKAFQK